MIPKIFHQIWIGNEIPEARKKLMLHNAKILLEKGWSIMFWGNDTLTKENFPITYEYIQKSNAVGKKLSLSKWAQKADLMRYEIMYNYGGVYMDSAFQLIGDKLDLLIKKANKSNKKIIVAPEDDCGSKYGCKYNGEDYVANGFFAIVPKSPIMKKALDKSRLNKINFTSKAVQRETGPYYFRQSFSVNKNVMGLSRKDVYPVHWSAPLKNTCLSNNIPKNTNFAKIKSKNGKVKYISIPCKTYKSMAIDHFILGGTWL